MRTSFSIYISRKSGARVRPQGTKLPIDEQIAILDDLMSTAIPDSEPGLQVTQLSLIRCRYPAGELSHVQRKTPGAACLLARSIVETALIESFLAFYGGEYASRMMKALGGPLRGYANASPRAIALLYWPCCLTSGSSPSP